MEGNVELNNMCSVSSFYFKEYPEELIEKLKHQAKRVRRRIVESVFRAQSGHPGGSLSAVELLVSLYSYKMNYSKENMNDPSRDIFVLSKGHSAPALYSIFAELGIIEENELLNLRQVSSDLQGHPDRLLIPGVEASTGSLGQGLSIAIGMALASKIDKKNNTIYVMLGDGEMQEGQVWEGFMTAGYRKLDNIVAIIDYNKIQLDGWVDDIKSLEPLSDKIKAFRWEAVEIDGHNFTQILSALDYADNVDIPFAIIAHTIKGKGVSFMENNPKFHGKAPTGDEYKVAIEEIKDDD